MFGRKNAKKNAKVTKRMEMKDQGPKEFLFAFFLAFCGRNSTYD